MATYRNIHLSFWTDNKIVDDFTPEDRYFYLYLLTNPHTNLCGCYEISIKQISNETGYNKDSIENLIKRFELQHEVIQYSPETREILINNWNRYNWTKSEKLRKPLLNEIQKIKSSRLRLHLANICNGYGMDTSCINTNCMDTTVTVTDTDTVYDSVSDINNNTNNNIYKEQKEDCNANDLIEKLWKLYPRKRGKSSISKKAKKKICEIGYEPMARAIERYCSEVKGKDEQFVLIGSTFFNGRYEDYLDENYVPPMTRTEQNAQMLENFIRGGDDNDTGRIQSFSLGD